MLLPNTIIGVKPVFDYSNNMRLVLLPADTKLGSVIYRLRASDGDEDYPLEFTAYGKKYLKVNHFPKALIWPSKTTFGVSGYKLQNYLVSKDQTFALSPPLSIFVNYWGRIYAYMIKSMDPWRQS